MPAIRLVVFDLDGTLVDSRLDLAESANELLVRHHAEPLQVDRIVAMVGEGARVLVERVLAAAAPDKDVPHALDEFLTIYERRLVRHTRPYPGVVEALDILQGHATLAVLTNKPSRHTGLLMDALDLGRYFADVVGDDGRFARKPAPDGLSHLMTRHRSTPETTVLVGDSDVDVETARRAGCRICVARYGFGRAGEHGVVPSDAIEVMESANLRVALLSAVKPQG